MYLTQVVFENFSNHKHKYLPFTNDTLFWMELLLHKWVKIG